MESVRNVRVLTEAALAIALAFVLSFVKLLDLPFGGSISLEMVPLILLALRQGVVPGVLAGVVYGFLSLLVDPFIVHPVQVLLDYPIAFGALGLAGLFRPTTYGTVLGTLMATAARFVAHFLSGVVFFATFAPEVEPRRLLGGIQRDLSRSKPHHSRRRGPAPARGVGPGQAVAAAGRGRRSRQKRGAHGLTNRRTDRSRRLEKGY